MPFVQVSVRQTEYTSKNKLQIQSNATLSSCLLQQQNINISGSISVYVCGYVCVCVCDSVVLVCMCVCESVRVLCGCVCVCVCVCVCDSVVLVCVCVIV